MEAIDKTIAVFVALIGVAIVAVVLSRKSATADVIRAAGGAFGGILSIAVSPITGAGGVAPGASGPGPMTPQAAAVGGNMGNIFGGIIGGSNVFNAASAAQVLGVPIMN